MCHNVILVLLLNDYYRLEFDINDFYLCLYKIFISFWYALFQFKSNLILIRLYFIVYMVFNIFGLIGLQYVLVYKDSLYVCIYIVCVYFILMLILICYYYIGIIAHNIIRMHTYIKLI